MNTETITQRLEYLRAELQGLADHIEPGDVELLEAAGVPETSIDAETDKQTVRDAVIHMYFADDDVQIDDDAPVEKVDGGYWVTARIFYTEG